MEQQPNPNSRRTERRQHLTQCLEAGTITRKHHDEQMFRMTNGARSGAPNRARLRVLAVSANKSYSRGKIDLASWKRKLADVRAKCAASGFAPIPEAEPVEPTEGTGISRSKAQALKALHDSRRGVRIHPLPVRVETALTLIETLLNAHNGANGKGPIPSVRSMAPKIGVNARSVHRWLNGTLHPDPKHHPAILAWAASCKAALPKDRSK